MEVVITFAFQGGGAKQFSGGAKCPPKMACN